MLLNKVIEKPIRTQIRENYVMERLLENKKGQTPEDRTEIKRLAKENDHLCKELRRRIDSGEEKEVFM